MLGSQFLAIATDFRRKKLAIFFKYQCHDLFYACIN
jgi:hypothetical protein